MAGMLGGVLSLSAAQIIDPTKPEPKEKVDEGNPLQEAIGKQEMIWQQLVLVDEMASRGSWREASGLLSTLISRSPDDQQLLKRGTYLFSINNQWELARACCEGVLEENPRDASTHLRLCVALLMLNEVEAASSHFVDAQANFSKRPEAYVVNALIRQKRNVPHGLDEVVQLASLEEIARMAFWLHEYRRLVPRGLSAMDYTAVSSALVQLPRNVVGGRESIMAGIVERLSTLFEGVQHLHQALGQEDAGQARKALASLREVAQPVPVVEAYGLLVDHLNRVPDARERFKRVVDEHPEHLRLLLLYGHLCLEDADYREAYRVFEAVRQSLPGNMESAYFAVLALLNAGDVEAGWERLNRLARRSPRRAPAALRALG